MIFPLVRSRFVVCALACFAPPSLAQQLVFEESGSGSDAYGWALTGIGDLNGDGVRDLLVGAPQVYSITASGAGYVQLLSGADGSLIYQLTGAAFGDAFGHSLATLGDVTGDGLDDFAVGARQATQGVVGGGYVRIYSGADGSIVHEVIETEPGARAGEDMAALGDLSGDGVPDLLYSVPNKEVNGIPGRGLVVLLASSRRTSSRRTAFLEAPSLAPGGRGSTAASLDRSA